MRNMRAISDSERNKRKLVLLVNGFPYGHREAYIAAEIPYLSAEFDEILLASLNIRSRPEPEIPECELDFKREVPCENVKLLPICFASKLVYSANGFCCLWDRNFWTELGNLRNARRLNLRTFFSLLKYISRARYEERFVSKQIKRSNFFDDAYSATVYSYRFDYQPYIGLLLKKKWPFLRLVARAHGRDLYEERVSANYIPLRKTLLDNLDDVHCISNHGKSYLQKRFPDKANKCHVSRLGTNDHGWNQAYKKNDGELRIATCSFLVPVKRVHIVAEALKEITDIDIKWTHFGDGPEAERLKDLCDNLPVNIEVDFMGTVTNDKVLEEYVEHPFDLFINVSKSEGVPVSIMEALSAGIPVIATDVGGTGEIVQDGINGWLLPESVTSEELANRLCEYDGLSEHELVRLRANARSSWASLSDAAELYGIFAKNL